MKFIRTSYCFFIVGLAAVFLFPAALVLFVASLIGFRAAASQAMFKIAKYASKLILFCAGCKIIVSGTENIPQKTREGTGLCFVCNHSGIADILLMFIAVNRPFGFIAKKEILFVPFINLWLVLLGGLFIDRNNPRKSLATLKIGMQKIKDGLSIAIFPEGTRSRGRGILPFKSGSFQIALESGADIVPVALSGSYELFEKTRWVIPVPLSVSFGKAIKTRPENEGGRRFYSDKAHGEIASLLPSR
ncbi:MAG: 1-acyl-sn-glycerol-3-phosphate acyltransferase [Spirochaetaceae bacterium]|jgi:1-acyl-sn-glycerol-3-phosphate acyltransferase|nr:1-acyl-sn-glycerol-3-phosphate acyltransferase [Spirochaetaceae bacterium]